MKRLLLICHCLAGFWLATQAANTITVTGGSGHPGDEVTVSVSMSGTDAVTALELQLPLGEWLSYVDGSCTLSAERSDGHTATAASVPSVSVAGSTLRIYAYSLGLKAFKGTEGEVLSFHLKLGDAPGDFTLSPTVLASDANGNPCRCETTTGVVTIQCPALSVTTTVIDFGHVPIRSSYEGILTLQNYGNEPLTISNIVPNDGELAVSPTTLIIPAGSSASTTVTYSPLKRVPFEATLTIESDAVNAKIYNKWQTAKVVADPFSVNELHVVGAQGASDTEVEIALKMNNMEPIVGAQVSFRLPSALKYVEGSAAMTDRSDGHIITASVSPLPHGEGQGERLTLFVYSATNKAMKEDDGNFATFRLSLEGQSGWYWLSPENVILSNTAMENMTSATSGEYVQIQSPTVSGSSTLNFGQQDATKPLTATYSINNVGQAALVLEKATFLADGFRVVTPLPLNIATSQSAEIEVEYTADHAGDFSTTMNLYTNDPATRVKAVAISGTAFSPNELTIGGTRIAEGCLLSIGLVNDAAISAVQFTLTPSLAPVGITDSSPLSARSAKRHSSQGASFALKGEGDVAVTPSARLANHTANIYPMGDGTFKVLIFSMTNACISGNEGELLSILVPAEDNTQDVTFALSDVVLSSPDGRNLLSPVTTLPQDYTFEGRTVLLGDTNGDGEVDIADAVNIINYINRGEQPGVVFDVQAADVNGDGEIDIADKVRIIEIINNK